MDSRERTFIALGHQEPDRVPVDCWASPAVQARLERTTKKPFELFLDLHDVDLRYIQGPRYTGPPLAGNGSALEVDIWGVPRRRVDVHISDETGVYSESYQEVVCSPLRRAGSVEEILGYGHWPSADWFDYSAIEKQCRIIRDAGRVVVFMGNRLNRMAQLKSACYLRGFEQAFIDMVESPDIAAGLFRKITEFYLEYGQRILEAARGKSIFSVRVMISEVRPARWSPSRCGGPFSSPGSIDS